LTRPIIGRLRILFFFLQYANRKAQELGNFQRLCIINKQSCLEDREPASIVVLGLWLKRVAGDG
jgi:hypothetical protein